MSAPLLRYVHGIKSIKEKIPELPDSLEHVVLNEGIPVGAPIRASDLSEAESVAAALRAIRGTTSFNTLSFTYLSFVS